MTARWAWTFAAAWGLAGGATAAGAPEAPPAASTAAGAASAPSATGATGDRGAAVEPRAENPTDAVVEATQRQVRAGAEWLARGVDSWFGDRPFESGGSVTEGRVSLGLLKRPREGLKLTLRFNARFRLPNLEERYYVFVGRDNPREVVTDKPGAFTRQQRLLAESRDDNDFFAGLGLSLRESTDLRLGVRGGIKPYAQARYKKPWTIGEVALAEFRQTFFWTVDDNLGSTTAFSLERALNPALAVRWLSSATITQQERRWEWNSIVGGYHLFGRQRQLALEGLVTGRQGSGVGLTDYGLQARWQQPVLRDDLLGELIVGHFWPRADATVTRGSGWAVGGVLKLKF